MAKTSKKVVRNRKTSKKNQKFKKLRKIFDPSSARGKLLIFIVAFAVIGGGYYTYQTFAAKALLATPGSETGSVECRDAGGTALKETSGSKRNLYVCQLSNSQVLAPVLFSDGKVKSTNEASYLKVTKSLGETGYFRVCFTVKKAGTSSASVAIGGYAPGSSPLGGTVHAVADADYKSLCDNTKLVAGSTRVFLKVNSGSVRVSSVGLEPVAAPKATTPSTSTGSTRCPAFPKFPDENCTGTLPGVARVDHSGGITTTKDGQVIENMNINGGMISVKHANVIIRNVRIRNSGDFAIYINASQTPAAKNLLVEDCELDGSGNRSNQTAIAEHNYTMRRCKVINYGEGPRSNGNVTLEDNYIAKFDVYCSPGCANDPHADAFQITSGSKTVVRHNVITMDDNTRPNASVMTGTYPGSDILFEKNLFGGGVYVVRCGNPDYSNVRYFDNRWLDPVTNGFDPGYGPMATCESTNLVENRWQDGPSAGQLIKYGSNKAR